MAASRLRAACVALSIGAAIGCLEPTEAIVEISTDASCEDVRGTGITAGLLFDIETTPYGTTTESCSGGDIGSMVLLPGEDDENDAAFAFKVVTSLGVPVETCVAPEYGPSCIVARRALRYVPHEPFQVPVKMALACAGVVCPPEQTCIDGNCQSATCEAPGSCEPEPETPSRFVDQFGGEGNQMARAVAFRNSTLVVAGNFDSSIDLGEGALASRGSQDAFLAAFTPGGVLRWSRSFGGDGRDEAVSVAIDASSDVYVLATFSGTVDLGSGPLTSAGATDVLLARYKSFGQLVWAQSFGGPGGDTPGNVVTADDGGLHIVGSFSDTAAVGRVQLESAGGSDGFVASISDSGEVRWARALGGAGDDGATTVAADALGNVYVGGYFEGEMEGATEKLVAVGAADAFLASFDAAGLPRWSEAFGGKGRDLVMGLAGSAGRVVATGVLASASTYRGLEMPAKNQDGFVLAVDADGNPDWARVFGGEGGDQGESASIADDGSIAIGGQIFDGSAFGSQEITLGGLRHPFVALLDPNGDPRWSRVQPSGMYAGGPAVAAAPEGFAYLVGWFVDEMEVGEQRLQSEGAEDAFVVRAAPPDADAR